MTEILFYHLTEHRLERALPTLVERSLGRGWRVVVQTGVPGRVKDLSKLLWTFRPDSFVANGHADDGGDRAADQPVWLTDEEDRPNEAQVRFLVDGATAVDLAPYERAIFMFDGHDEEAVEQARAEWTQRKGMAKLTYWKQGEDGRWEVGASSDGPSPENPSRED